MSGVTRPSRVLLDGRPIEPRDQVEAGPEPGWRYDEANAYLAIRVDRDGPVLLQVEGAEFRPIRRIPSPVDRVAFEFDDSTGGWTPAHDVGPLALASGQVSGRITGPDPYVVRNLVNVPGDECPVIRFRLRVTAGEGGRFFWTTRQSPSFAEDKSATFPLQPDGRFHDYHLDLGRHPNWAGQHVTALRIDPGSGVRAAEFAIDYVRGVAE
ncbi:MAG: hypothetical protein ACYC6Y_02040 [Thermoguttaceae bacterium]